MGIPEFSWRLARSTEAAAIAAMSRDLVEYGLAWRWTPARVAASIQATNVNVLVASARGKIAGFAIMRYGVDTAHLDLLAVAPFYRRAGVGRRLLQWLEKCAVVAGIFSIALEVRETNEGARRFYERMGYQRSAQLPGYYQGIEAALRMSRDLSCPFPLDRAQTPQRSLQAEKTLQKIFRASPRNLDSSSNYLPPQDPNN